MTNCISVCRNCFNMGEYCTCNNSSIINVPFGAVGGTTDEAVNKLIAILDGDDLTRFISDLENNKSENQFAIRRDNQIMLLHIQFEYDCFPHNGQYNNLEKSKQFEKTGKCSWLHWQSL